MKKSGAEICWSLYFRISVSLKAGVNVKAALTSIGTAFLPISLFGGFALMFG